MSGAIDYMLDVIERTIPSKLLDIVFKPAPINGINNITYSIREQIRLQVINDWCLRDINTLGIKDMALPLSMALINTANLNQTIIYMPKACTGGRRIMGLSKLGFFNPYAYSGIATMGVVGTVEMQKAISKMAMSVTQIPRVETGYVTLISENTFLVEDYICTPDTAWMGVLLEADDYLSDIKPPYYGKMGEFALLACKAVIYRVMASERDAKVLQGGQELGVLGDMVSGWSDTAEQYQDFRAKRLKKILSFNDFNAKISHIKAIVH